MLKTAGEIIKDSWSLYTKNWRKFVPFMALIFLPTLILSALGTISLYLSIYLPSSTTASNIIILVVFAASMVFAIWVTIALTKALNNALLSQPSEWKETFLSSSNLIWPTIITSFFVTLSVAGLALLLGLMGKIFSFPLALIVVGGSFLLIFPGIVFAIWYAFASYAVIFDNVKGLNAMRASKSLVVGRWLSIFWKLFITTVLFGFLSSVLSSALAYAIKMIPLPIFIQSASASALTALVSAILAPLSAGAVLILYQSAKQNPVMSSPTL